MKLKGLVAWLHVFKFEDVGVDPIALTYLHPRPQAK